jgi:hypothetical protein
MNSQYFQVFQVIENQTRQKTIDSILVKIPDNGLHQKIIETGKSHNCFKVLAQASKISSGRVSKELF